MRQNMAKIILKDGERGVRHVSWLLAVVATTDGTVCMIWRAHFFRTRCRRKSIALSGTGDNQPTHCGVVIGGHKKCGGAR